MANKYDYVIGVIGWYNPKKVNEQDVTRQLNTFYDEIEKQCGNVAFLVGVGYNGLAKLAAQEAQKRHWGIMTVSTAVETFNVHCDAMICIGGSDEEKQQLERFQRRFRELPKGKPLPVFHYQPIAA
jgi:activator of 2-hydroxyglutaryl-CoA dehydratase